MISIAICDDHQSVVDNLADLIEKYAEAEQEDIKIYKFHSGIQLLDKYSGNYDMIFLDIKMPNMDGMETAVRLRKRDKSVAIIFLTSIVKYALEGYSVSAESYIIKPIYYKRLKVELDRWREKKGDSSQSCIVIKNNQGSYKIRLKDLSYIETSNRNAMIHSKDKDVVCYRKLKNLEEELKNKGFSRCHSSYIINLAYVENVERMEITLISGEIIPIGKSRKKAFMQQLAAYWGEQI